MLEEEELYWHKRSNLNWLLQGDNNTELFHRIANGKKRKNLIFNLEHEGNILEKDKDILTHATNYYRELFGPSKSPVFHLDPNCWGPEEKVTQEENEKLVSPFTMEELRVAVFSLEKNTAPGPDHMPVEFYQSGWEIVKQDLLDMLIEFGVHKLNVGRLNYGVVTLIPKLKEACKIQQYRPICLLNVSFKIITKILMMRLEGCMSKIINKCQTTFIKGRNIMDGVMILHEIVHDVKVRKKDGVILKLDFEKAYDKISWEFFFEMLKQRGFCESWCKWMREVVSSGTLSVKVNGLMGGYFKCGKGVRQGNPLSPLLFNLAADSLAKMIHKAQENNLVEGLVPEYVQKGIAVLQYADDTILCLKGDSAKHETIIVHL
jgi:hypothetical protein